MELFALVTIVLAVTAILFDMGFWTGVAQGHRRWRRAVDADSVSREWPVVQVVVCLKGQLPRLPLTIRSLEEQDYPGEYRITFVTEAAAHDGDPAAEGLAREMGRTDRSEHVVAGRVIDVGARRAQKNHNLLAGIAAGEHGGLRPEAYAFLDGDLVARPEWLTEMIRPLLSGRAEATTSFHDIEVPGRRITEALHALAEASQSFAALACRDPWGGSMAILRDTFRRCRLADFWGRAVVDDLTMSCALRKSRVRIAAIPKFLVSSDRPIPEYRHLVKWLGRQFFFVKVYLPSHWFLLCFRSSLATAVLGTAAFHTTWRLLEGSWAAGPVAGWMSIAGAAGVFAATASSRFFLPGKQPLMAWVPANLLFPGTVLIACADASLRRQRLTWSDLTYELDDDGWVSGVAPATVVSEEAA